MTIAGRSVEDTADFVITYLEGRNFGTSQRILDYDFAAFERRENLVRGASVHRIAAQSIDSAKKLGGSQLLESSGE
jgi:hypothetical protein